MISDTMPRLHACKSITQTYEVNIVKCMNYSQVPTAVDSPSQEK